MKVIAINGSAKPKGNTFTALNLVCDELNEQGIDTEVIQVGHMDIQGCIGCGRCENGHCHFSDEKLREIVDKIHEAEGLLLGTPVYYAGIAGGMKSFLDRLFYPSRGSMRLKVGAAIAVPRRSGGMTTFDQLNSYFLISEMLIAPSYYWNVIHGAAPGEVLEDSEGVCIMKNLANNMAWLLKMKEYSKDVLPQPQAKPRVWTNFIR